MFYLPEQVAPNDKDTDMDTMTITTKKTSNGSGAGVIVATSGKTQKTTRYDHSKSSDWNYGAAAAALLHHMDKKGGNFVLGCVMGLHEGRVKHETLEGGGKHRFTL